jgi:peptidoglycan/xylan/chitin deacetylase (PgdA/CDA1 family)
MTYVLFASLLACAVIFLYAGVLLIYGRYSRTLLRRKATKARTLVLTFDDGPSNRLTPIILKVLTEYNAKATFFLLGRNIAGREQIVRQIAAQGHEICSHGYDHLDYWRVSPLRTIKDIKKGWQAIDAALGTKRGKYPFRPPKGRLSIVCLLYLLFERVPIVWWSADVGDTRRARPEPESLALAVKKAGGAVLLAHDFNRVDESTNEFVLQSTRLVLAAARQANMRICTVSQLLNGDFGEQ